jgi:hypothetical protein
MSLREELEAMERWQTVGVAWLLERLEEIEEPEEVTTRGASERLGRSVKFWRMAAESGAIEGAYRDSEDSPWRLPLASCRKHLLRKQTRKGGLRGPTRKATSAQTARPRSPGIPEGPVLERRFKTMGGPTLRVEESA